MRILTKLVIAACTIFIFSSCGIFKSDEPTDQQIELKKTLEGQMYDDMPGSAPFLQASLGGGYKTSKTDIDYKWVYFPQKDITLRVNKKSHIISEVLFGRHGTKLPSPQEIPEHVKITWRNAAKTNLSMIRLSMKSFRDTMGHYPRSMEALVEFEEKQGTWSRSSSLGRQYYNMLVEGKEDQGYQYQYKYISESQFVLRAVPTFKYNIGFELTEKGLATIQLD